MTTMTEWTTNASLADIASWIRAGTRVAVLTHAKADGDALGATQSVARALAASGLEVRAVYAGPFPDRFRELVDWELSVVLDEGDEASQLSDEWYSGVDRVIVLDTGSWAQLAEVRSFVEPRATMAALVDHHASGDPDVAGMRHIDTSAASAAELAGELCCGIFGVESMSELPVEIATVIYLGMATDTGWFKHPSTTSRTMRTAASLHDAGVDANALRRLIEQSDTVSRLWLMQRAMSSLRLHCGDRVSVMSLTTGDFAKTDATPDDAGGLIDLPMSVERVLVSVLLTDRGDGVVKVSMRSKAGSTIVDVNNVAGGLGGGGHVHAAGAKVSGVIDAVEMQVVEAIAEQLP
ncbi:MAG: DHH family phosphoesterase [Planctomycetota bacterium]